MTHLLSNTDKDYKCVNCGTENVSVIRQDKEDPRLKCNNCNFLFNASDSKAAQEAGSIPTSSAETLETADLPEMEVHNSAGTHKTELKVNPPSGNSDASSLSTIPRTPRYVFISRDRQQVEFCGSKNVKRTTLKWEQSGRYDVYELIPKKFDVKLQIV